jgi:hypothetical protein
MAALIAALVIAGSALALNHTAKGDQQAPDSSPDSRGLDNDPQPSQPAPNPTTPTETPVVDGHAWPRTKGACGNEAPLPRLSVQPLHVPTGLDVLVGGSGLRLVDVDSGRVQRVAGPGGEQQVAQLAGVAGRIYALAQPCSSQLSVSNVLSVNVDRLDTQKTPLHGVDDLLAGGDGAWAFRYVDTPPDEIALQSVDGGSPLRMPVGFAPQTATSSSFIGSLAVPGDQAENQTPHVAVVDRASLAVVRRLGRGDLTTGTDTFVLYSSCRGETCRLLQQPSVGAERQLRLPPGRVPTSAIVLSGDRRTAAFQLARSRPDPNYDPGHPGPPSDLAVLNLVTGKLRVLPGVEFAPKSGPGLAFSRNSTWLLITLNEGNHSRLLVWRHGWDRPQQASVTLPGSISFNVPVLDVDR